MSNPIIWTAEKLEILRDLYPTTPANDIADRIGCSDCTVLKKAKELGLKRDPSFDRNHFIGRYTRNRGKYNIYSNRNYERRNNEQHPTTRPVEGT